MNILAKQVCIYIPVYVCIPVYACIYIPVVYIPVYSNRPNRKCWLPKQEMLCKKGDACG